MTKKVALIIGAGPAGLTAAYELATRSDIQPIVIEASEFLGGISRTLDYKGNKIDLGGHRFFSKSERVLDWWQNILPIQTLPAELKELKITYHNKIHKVKPSNLAPDPDNADEVMLVRKRRSRILHGGKFYSYPPNFSLSTINNLGLIKSFAILASYLKSHLCPRKPEMSFEDFLINRFGKMLYLQFFKSYTEKVWGVPCTDISADWGVQRIKGLSIKKLLLHPFSLIFKQKTETSLIEWFLYPKFGPGQMWETTATLLKNMGGEILIRHKVTNIEIKDNKATSATILDILNNKSFSISCDYLFSSMPVVDLINSINPQPKSNVNLVANGLLYRNFITVGVLLNKLSCFGGVTCENLAEKLPDNWLYIQEENVKLGRIQIFNNWSPYLIADSNTIWVGLEYFCGDDDSLWQMSDDQLKNLAIEEAQVIDFFSSRNVIDMFVARMPKAYPAYFGTYSQMHVIQEFSNKIENLFPIGRNGMHKYNNQDHSMLTAMTAVDNILSGIKSKDNIWAVNTDEAYHEENEP